MSYEKTTLDPPPICPRCLSPRMVWVKGNWHCTVCGYGNGCCE